MQREGNGSCLCNEEIKEIRNASKRTGICPYTNVNKESIDDNILKHFFSQNALDFPLFL